MSFVDVALEEYKFTVDVLSLPLVELYDNGTTELFFEVVCLFSKSIMKFQLWFNCDSIRCDENYVKINKIIFNILETLIEKQNEISNYGFVQSWAIFGIVNTVELWCEIVEYRYNV